MSNTELAGGYVHKGYAHLFLIPHQGQQVVVGLLLQQAGLHHRTRGYHSHHIPFHQASGGGGVAHLLTDGHLMAGVYEPDEIAIQGMMGYACHGVALAPAHLSGGKGYTQLLRGELGVLVEGLVEVPKTEEDDGIGVALLYAKILSSNGSAGQGSGTPFLRPILQEAPLRGKPS